MCVRQSSQHCPAVPSMCTAICDRNSLSAKRFWTAGLLQPGSHSAVVRDGPEYRQCCHWYGVPARIMPKHNTRPRAHPVTGLRLTHAGGCPPVDLGAAPRATADSTLTPPQCMACLCSILTSTNCRPHCSTSRLAACLAVKPTSATLPHLPSPRVAGRLLASRR